MKIAIVGCGVFGGAMGSVLEKKGHIIFKEDQISQCEVILVAVPSFVVRKVLLSYKEIIKDQKIIICSKGLNDDGELLSTDLKKDFPNNNFYFLYGPTLAEELRTGSLSVMVLAGEQDVENIKKEIESENLIIKTTNDIIGVQIGAALKNTVNIFVGLVEGANLGQNTEALVYTKGLEEIKKIGLALGAQAETFLGYTCAGDLFLRSRSRNFGCEIGQGKTFEEVDKEFVYPKEGVATLQELLKREKEIGLDLSFFKIISQIIFEKLPVAEAVNRLAQIV